MKPWLRFVLLALLLVLLSFTRSLWLSPLLDFITTNTDLIQGLTDFVQLILWVGALSLGWMGYTKQQEEKTTHTEGATVHGPVDVS